MLRVYRSNRAERLVAALADVLAAPLTDPLAAEHVVVQSRGMERWLAMQLSQRLGVAANLQFPFPRHLLERAFDVLLREEPERAAPFARDALAWSVAEILNERIDEPAFALAKRYVEGDEGGVLCMQLARRLGEALDDYAVYRPELLLAWQEGAEPEDLQAELARALVKRHGAFHQAARAERLKQVLRAPASRIAKALEEGELPQRVCLFGIASLPPLYVELLAALSRYIETHLFVVTPSSGYFADLRRKSPEGHPLLASLGRLSRDFQEVLIQHDVPEGDDALFEDPGTDTLLHALQSDMLHVRNRGAAGDVAALPLAASDHSIAIHACHSPMREVEVLHDQLARLLEDEALQPHEIVVMAPDIETYAPVIEAVFSQREGRPQIPYSIAHRGLKPESAVLDTLQAALDLLAGRVTASGLLDLLGRDPVRERLDLSPDDVETLRAWVESSGIRWGIDERDRADVGQPALVEGTFRFGIERMLLGYALEGRGEVLFGGRLPFDAVQGHSAQLAGAFADFCERLFAHRAVIRASRTVAQWAEAFERLLGEVVGEGTREHALERVAIRAAMAELVQQAELAGFAQPIALRAIWSAFERSIDSRSAARGFLSRGVTFCQLVPMRSVPFKVACLLGMGDERFPTRRTVHGFDRVQQKTRLGDRVPREDDRHVFLEAILCAREKLLITYVGRSAHDDRELPAAVVVTDLIDAVARGFVLPQTSAEDDPRAAMEKRLTVRHRLHAFSARYFTPAEDAQLFSYAASYCEGAAALGRSEPERPFIGGVLPLGELNEVSVDRLAAWITQPIKTLVQRELGVALGNEFDIMPDREPGELDPLADWILGTELASALLRGVPESSLLDLARASGSLPVGANGVVALEEVLAFTQRLVGAVRSVRVGERLPPAPVDLVAGGIRITGALRALWPSVQLEVSFSKQGKRFELAHFVRHVVLCALNEQGRTDLPSESVVIGKAMKGEGVFAVKFERVEQPMRVLTDMIETVRRARRGELGFDHDAAYEYVAAFYAKEATEESRAVALRDALRDAFGGKFPDQYLQLVHTDERALEAAGFAQTALRVFAPMMAVRQALVLP